MVSLSTYNSDKLHIEIEMELQTFDAQWQEFILYYLIVRKNN